MSFIDIFERSLTASHRSIGRIEEALRDHVSSAEEAASLRKAQADLAVGRVVARDRARRAHRDLIIQQEAVGLRGHLDVERCYQISERLR